MRPFQIDSSSKTPAYKQICEHVVQLIESGHLKAGDRLPPTRELAETLGVHRSTVVRAYEEIRALGYLEARSGAYSRVRARARPPQTRSAAPAGRRELFDWAPRAVPPLRDLASRHLGSSSAPASALAGKHQQGELIDFQRLAADPSLAPAEEVRRALKSALTRERLTALDYSDAQGWLPLREVIAERMARHGIAVSPDEVLITAGAQQAIDLALRLLTRPGDTVALEAPSYGMAHELLRLHQVNALEIPLRDDGLDLRALKEAFARQRPKLLYTIPTFQNPTGITTDQAHREALLAICEREGVPIIEDGFEEEMKYFGRAVLPIKSMDERGLVLYVGSFSKVVFPGLRIGWIVGARGAIERLSALMRGSCLSGNTLTQAAAARFARGADYERYLRRVHGVYRGRMRALLAGLERYVRAEGVEWTRPKGGYTLWLRLPRVPGMDDLAWVERFRDAGVLVAPGRWFFARAPRGVALRVSIACVGEEQIVVGCRRMGGALRPGG